MNTTQAAMVLETVAILTKLTQQVSAVLSAQTPEAQAQALATAQQDVQTAASAFDKAVK